MVAENIAFGVLAAAMALSAIGVVTTKNVVHAALFLVVVLAGGAGQFILLGQEFVAWVQVLVYIGAVIVLFLFGIMLTRAPMHPKDSLDNDLRWPGLVVSLFLGGILAALMIDAFDDSKIELERPTRTIEVTNSLFRNYIIPFEVVGILLLAALIGAVVLAEGLRIMLLNQFLLLSAFLFCTGIYGVLTRKHTVLVLMSVELMLAAVNINLVAFGAYNHTVAGQVFALFVLTIAAAEVGVGLAIVLLIYRNLHSADLDDVDVLKG